MVYTGADGYCAALGMTEDQKKKHVSDTLGYKWDVSRQPNGVVQIKSNSPYTPGGLINVKAGEPWSYQLAGFGTSEVNYNPVFSTLIGPAPTRLGSHWSRSSE